MCSNDDYDFLITVIALRLRLICIFLKFSDIMNRKARLAWELYLKMEKSGESFSLLQLIANDCYKVNGCILHYSLFQLVFSVSCIQGQIIISLIFCGELL